MGTHHRRQEINRLKRQLRRWWQDKPVQAWCLRLRPGLAPELASGPLGAPWLSRTAGRRVLRPLPPGWAANVARRMFEGLVVPMQAFAVAAKKANEQAAQAFLQMAATMTKLRQGRTP